MNLAVTLPDSKQRHPTILLKIALSLSVSEGLPDWEKTVFERLYDWYFVPRQSSWIKQAEREIDLAWQKYCQSYELPKWFEQAAHAYYKDEPEVHHEDVSGQVYLTEVERNVHRHALAWCASKGVAIDPFDEELILGVRTHAAFYQETRITPSFMHKTCFE